MLTDIVLIIVCVIAIVHIVNSFRTKEENKISFKETFDLLNAPIITFLYNGEKLHFLFDTGSSLSHIRPEIVERFGINKVTSNVRSTLTASGIIKTTDKCNMQLEYKGKGYIAEFLISRELVDQLDAIKRDWNLDIHGVLGCNFFDRYNYVIDFKELVAYSRK